MNTDVGQVMFHGVQKGIDFGLPPVKRVFFAQTFFRMAAGGLDLVDDRDGAAFKYAVDPAGDVEHQIRRFHPVSDADLRSVLGRPRILNFLVEFDGVHRAGGPGKLDLEVAAAQHELDQLTYADGLMGFHGLCSSPIE